MTNIPLISVAIPSYNHESYVQETIRSVINQDYKNIELIIIDDGSSDNSVEKIREIIPACEKRFVRFSFRSRGNKGLSATLNEAIAWCQGGYFSAIASDDVMYRSKTSVLLNYLEEDQGVAGVFCGCNIIDSHGAVIGTFRTPNAAYKFDDILLRKHHFIAPTQLYRIDCLRHVGGYKNDVYIEDWYMSLALTEKGYQLRVVDELLTGYRKHDTNISRNALKVYEERKKLLRYFKNKKNYKKSLAIICLMASIDFTSISKIKSIGFMIEGISYSRHIFLTSYFYNCLLRILTPRFIILWLKKLINSHHKE